MSSFLTTIITHGDTIILAIVAIILGWKNFASGSSSLRKEIVADYKERNDQLDTKIKNLEEKLQETLREVSGLRATMVEKDKRIEEITLLNNDKNPDILKLLQKITDSNTSIMAFMQLMHKTLIDSKSELHFQTGILKKAEIRTDSIDKASMDGEGKPTLVPTNGV